jgi:signal transduction histidine kinase
MPKTKPKQEREVWAPRSMHARPSLPVALEDLRRTGDGERWLGGVASGIATRFAIDVFVVRIAFVALAFASGAGLALYAIAWVLVPEGGKVSASPHRRSLLASTAGDPVSALAFGAIILGLMLLIRQSGLPFPAWLMWPVLGIAVGASMIGHETRRSIERALTQTSSGTSGRTTRLMVGGLFVVVGVVGVVGGAPHLNTIGSVLFAVVACLLGLVIILLPWSRSMLSALSEERRGRIRSEEKAEIAAHLHDSVLQTLAIIQRKADDPKQVQALARRQERELRAWLFNEGATTPGAQETVRTHMDRMVQEIEDLHGLNVDFVCVGDCPLTGEAVVLLSAAREAMTNAGKHASTDKVDVYLEVEVDEIIAFIRDRGIGFDVNAVDDDRHGLSDSIVGRLSRAGGRAVVRSSIGEGTEVQLSIPRRTTGSEGEGSSVSEMAPPTQGTKSQTAKSQSPAAAQPEPKPMEATS